MVCLEVNVDFEAQHLHLQLNDQIIRLFLDLISNHHQYFSFFRFLLWVLLCSQQLLFRFETLLLSLWDIWTWQRAFGDDSYTERKFWFQQRSITCRRSPFLCISDGLPHFLLRSHRFFIDINKYCVRKVLLEWPRACIR